MLAQFLQRHKQQMLRQRALENQVVPSYGNDVEQLHAVSGKERVYWVSAICTPR